MSGPPPWTTTGFSPTYLSSTTSRANSSRSAGSSIAAPPYLMTTVRPWNSRMYGSASRRVATSRAGAIAPFCLQRLPGGGVVPPPPGPRLPLRTSLAPRGGALARVRPALAQCPLASLAVLALGLRRAAGLLRLGLGLRLALHRPRAV